MSLETPFCGVAHAATTPPAPSATRLKSLSWLLAVLAAITPPSAHERAPVESTRWRNRALGPARPSSQPTITPPAPSLTASGSTCAVPGVVTHTGTPLLVQRGVPSKRTRRANTSKSPPRSSNHTAMAPPWPSDTAAPIREL